MPQGELKPLLAIIKSSFITKRIARTTLGRLALVPHGTQKGDRVCALCGLEALGILRAQSDGEWNWVGQCFMPGVMEGEGIVGREDEGQEFILK